MLRVVKDMEDRAPAPRMPSPATTEEQRLAERLRAGDPAALRALMLAYYNRILRFVYTLTRSYASAEDVTVEVFEQVWERRGTIDPTGSVKTYLFAAARNRALNHLKHRSAVQRLEVRVAQELNAASEDRVTETPEDIFLAQLHATTQAAAVESMQRAIMELPERSRTALLLRFKQELSFRDIGELLGISDKAAQQVVIRTVATLRKKLRP